MTTVKTDRSGYVVGTACPCGGSPLVALPGGRLYVCPSPRCARAPLSAAQVFRLLNPAGRPALAAVRRAG